MDKNRKEKIKNAYDIASQKYAEKCLFELYDKPIDKKFYDLFFERVINRGMVLEIGCGPGEIANYLKLRGLDIIGIDISPEMIKIAKRFNFNIDFRIGDVFDLKFGDNSIAGIVASYLIVNFIYDDLPLALKEMHRIMMPGGILLLSFHLGDEEKEVTDFFVKGNTIHYTLFNQDKIKEIILAAGFKITEYIIRSPYKDEITNRAYIFACKDNSKS